MARARLRRGIEMVKLANRIEALKMQEDESETAPGDGDVPADAKAAAGAALAGGPIQEKGLGTSTEAGTKPGGKKTLSNLGKGAIFREVVLASVRDQKEKEQALKVEKEAQEKEAKRRSFQG
jgi:calcium/calmodulin-dependent protein kinase I